MAQQTADDDVLPFNQSDVRGGVGSISRIVSLSGYTDAEWVTSDGRCNLCGYDRGFYEGHTEVDAYTVTCQACEEVLHKHQ